MIDKIALEEHFAIPETIEHSQRYAPFGPESWSRLEEKLLSGLDDRLPEMDKYGIARAILSLNSPGIQSIDNVNLAVQSARRANDVLAGWIAKRPDRFAGFAALPMQSPEAAAAELTRCIRDFGFKGALVNGTSQVGDPNTFVYYDASEYLPFWAAVEQLDVPFYLHPRDPVHPESGYAGHPWLMGPVWAFNAETSLHALRLMASGLFDRYPRLKIILGHLGECLPYNVWRIDHRIAKSPRGIPARHSMAYYLRNNFYLTTSGNFRTPTLVDAIAEVGSDRILFSVDFPFEDTSEAAEWFDNVNLSEADRRAIGHSNAIALFNFERYAAPD